VVGLYEVRALNLLRFYHSWVFSRWSQEN